MTQREQKNWPGLQSKGRVRLEFRKNRATAKPSIPRILEFIFIFENHERRYTSSAGDLSYGKISQILAPSACPEAP